MKLQDFIERLKEAADEYQHICEERGYARTEKPIHEWAEDFAWMLESGDLLEDD